MSMRVYEAMRTFTEADNANLRNQLLYNSNLMLPGGTIADYIRRKEDIRHKEGNDQE